MPKGRVVLADALAYAVAELAPDYLVDLATLTGANAVALGKRTGALYSDNDDLAGALADAAAAAGEKVWRMPLVDDYVRDIQQRDRRHRELLGHRRRLHHRGALPARVHRRSARALGAHRHVGAVLGRRRRR